MYFSSGVIALHAGTSALDTNFLVESCTTLEVSMSSALFRSLCLPCRYRVLCFHSHLTMVWALAFSYMCQCKGKK